MTVAELIEELQQAHPEWEVEIFVNDEYVGLHSAVPTLDISENRKTVVLFGVDDDDSK